MINRLFNLTKENKQDKKVKKFMGQSLDEAIKRSSRLKKIQIHEFSGWVDFVQILDDYIKAVKDRKVKLRMDTITDEELQVSKWLDHEVWFLENYVKILISSFVEGLEKAVEKAQREEERKVKNDG